MGIALALGLGGALMAVAAHRETFERIVGPSLKAGFSLERRVLPWRRRTFEQLVVRVRVAYFVFGLVCAVLGLLGLLPRLL